MLIPIFFILPLTVFAHGQEILLPIFIQIISIIVFLIVLFVLKASVGDKLILFAAYALSLSLILYFTIHKPYSQNQNTVDLIWAAGPAFITLITFFILQKRVNRNEIKNGS